MNNLNIYKVSGLVKVGYTGRVNYWTAGTTDMDNTIAMNYVLSELNLLNAELNVTEDKSAQIELMNQMDLYTVILEGLFIAKDSQVYEVQTIGNVISSMVATNTFDCATDNLTTRANNLDAIITQFVNKLNNIPDNLQTDADFDIWFAENITADNYNSVPEAVKENYAKVAKVGATVNDITTKTLEAAPAFLYLFMTDKQLSACNNTIKKRYNQEVKNWQWETRVLRGYVNDTTLLNQYRSGIIMHYGKTPEKVIDELFALNEKQGGGKVGVDPASVSAIISAVVAIVGLLISLVYLIMDIYKISYEADDDYKEGVPDQNADGWSYGDALSAKAKGESLTGDKKKQTTKAGLSGGNTLMYLGIAAVALLAFLN